MPLSLLNNSTVKNNKENNYQNDPESIYYVSPNKNKASEKSPNQKCLEKDLNQLKIRLSDRQFQLKKMEEDNCLRLAAMQRELQKQRNQKKIVIKQSKQKLEQEKHYYQTKIDMLKDEFKKSLQGKQSKIRQQIKDESEQQKQTIIDKYQSKVCQLSTCISDIEKHYEELIANLKAVHQSQQKSLTQLHISELKELHLKFQKETQQIREKNKAQTDFYKQSQEFKSKQYKVVQKIYIQKLRNVQQSISSFKAQIAQLTQQIQQQKGEIVILSRESQNHRIDSLFWKRKHDRLQAELKDKFSFESQELKVSYETQLKAKIKRFSEELTKLQVLQTQSQTKYRDQCQILEERCNTIAEMHKTFKSNEEDLRKIEELEMKLIKAELQIQKQKQDMKICKLELGNMDELYHKMFEQAKIRSLKSKKVKLPSLLVQNRSTMDTYQGVEQQVLINKNSKQKKFGIRDCVYLSVSKSIKERDLNIEKQREINELQ